MRWIEYNLGRLGALIPLTIAVSAILLTPGCSSRSAYVVARHDVRYPLSLTNKIAIAEHAHPRPEEQSLRTVLMAELRERGFNVVPSTEAEYTLTYWIDVSWRRGKIVVSNREGTWSDPYSGPRGYSAPYAPPPFGPRAGSYYTPVPSVPEVVDVPWETQGIRLKVFPQESMRAGNLQTAWDGYIEGGDEVSEKREPVLVRTLLSYFGTEFIGRAKLVGSPATNQ